MRLGELELEDGVKGDADKEVESSVCHPEYKDGRFVNDIAVIKMKNSVNFNGNELFLPPPLVTLVYLRN